VPNFFKIGQVVAEISQFYGFQNGACPVPHLGFLKFQIFDGQDGYETNSASPYQILGRSVEPMLRYSSSSIFQYGARPPS